MKVLSRITYINIIRTVSPVTAVGPMDLTAFVPQPPIKSKALSTSGRSCTPATLLRIARCWQ